MTRHVGWWWPFLVGAPIVAGPAQSDQFEAGPAGSYLSVQEAIEDAVATPGGPHEVLVQQGTIPDCLTVPASFTNGTLSVTGGWDSSFTTQTLDPSLTLIDCEGLGRTLDVESAGTSVLWVSNLTLTGGLASGLGGGARLFLEGSASVTFEFVDFVGNVVTQTDSFASGGGLWASLTGSNLVRVSHCRMDSNIARATGTSSANVIGGALAVGVSGSGSAFQMDHCVLENNEADAAGTVYGGAVSLSVYGDESITFEDTVVRNNLVTAASLIVGSAVSCAVNDTGHLQARRIRILDHRNDLVTLIAYQAVFDASPSGAMASLVFTDSIIASTQGPDVDDTETGSLFVVAPATGFEAHLTNLTLVDGRVNLNGSGGNITFFNSILWGGVPAISAGALTGNNLINIDPMFVSVPSGDFRLQPGSVAIDAGTNSPPGGLGPFDVDAGPRVVGLGVDQGAHEDYVFADGFESGDSSRWSAATP